MEIAELPKASKGGRSFALDSDDSEKLLNMVIALTAEVSVLNDKVENLAAVAAKGLAFERDDVLAYQPDEEETKQRTVYRKDLVDRVLRIIHADFERQTAPKVDYEDMIKMVSGQD